MAPKPDLSHYPAWLRELIFPEILANMREGRESHQDLERSLRRVFEARRKDPVCDVLFEITLQSIRDRFKLYNMGVCISTQRTELSDLNSYTTAQASEISELKIRLKKLERKLKKLEKKGV